jgi:YHS domain-containing protein
MLVVICITNIYGQDKMHGHKKAMADDTASVIEQYKNIKDKEVREYMTNLHLEMIDKTKPTYKTWNTVCPVLGRPVNPKLKPVEYKGKSYGFCCKVCPPQFQENPEKYIKNLDKSGKKFIGIIDYK